METNFAKQTFSIYRSKNNDTDTFVNIDGYFNQYSYIIFLSSVDWKVQECSNIEDAIKIAKKKKKETNFGNAYFYVVTNDKAPQIVAIY